MKKGASAYNDMVADLESAQTEAEMSRVMSSWYCICHPIDHFLPEKSLYLDLTVTFAAKTFHSFTMPMNTQLHVRIWMLRRERRP